MAERHSSNRGFAQMDVEKQRQIASKGGRAAHQKGTAHQFTSEEAREAGRKGGSAHSSRARQNQARSDEQAGSNQGELVNSDQMHESDQNGAMQHAHSGGSHNEHGSRPAEHGGEHSSGRAAASEDDSEDRHSHKNG